MPERKKVGTFEYLEHIWNRFRDSFTNLDARILLVFIYDFLFYGTFLVLRSESAKLVVATDFSKVSMGTVIEIPRALVAITIALFGLILVLAYIGSNLLIWKTITGSKVNLKFTGKFFGLHLIWSSAWVILVLSLLSRMGQDRILRWLLVFTLVYLHLTIVLYMSYFEGKKVRAAVRKVFTTGVCGFHHFVGPYAFAGLTLCILYVLNSVLSVELAGIQVLMFAGAIVLLFYLAWLRIYIYSSLRSYLK